MDRSMSASAVKKLLGYICATSLLAACGGSGPPTETPVMTSLALIPNSEIKAGENLVVNSDCRLCDPAKTRYEWKVEGVDQAVSYEDYYRMSAENVTKQISVTATALSTTRDEGSSITRIYALNRVKMISGNDRAFAALKLDGTVVTWGYSADGGDNRSVADQLIDVKSISATLHSFSATKGDGSVVTWGNTDLEDSGNDVLPTLSDIQSTFTTGAAFAKINDDDTVTTWGSDEEGGDSGAVEDQLTDVQSISATSGAFAALKADGSVVTWGDPSRGSDSSGIADQLVGVQSLSATSAAFSAMKTDGSVVIWGDSEYGGFVQDTSKLEPGGIITLK